MTLKKLYTLAYSLKDLASLRSLFSELNYDFEDSPVSKDKWTNEQKRLVVESKIIASKSDYRIYYIQTDTDSIKQWKEIATKIIKENNGFAMVCSHNPGGLKWVFSSLSKEFSTLFAETRHVPIDIKPDVGVSKTFVEFLENIKVDENSTASSIARAISDAFDSFAVQIHEELTVNVFEALKILSEGIVLDKSNGLVLDEQTLEAIREPTFILLYRIMFVLYAEDRAVFPEGKFYYENFSLKWIKDQLILKHKHDIDEYGVQDRLKQLFKLIEVGSEALNYDPKEFFMRSYYGRLFDNKIHHKLESWNIPNKNLLDAIGLLTRTKDKQGNYFFLDYAALETRHLGAIYEHLLEFHLTAKNGKVADLPDAKERKSTGSYYTPKYIVDYIVETSVGPLIDKIVKNTQDPVTQIDEILALNVLDPAMGSGHFLIGATNYIAKRICEIEYTDGMSEQAFIERKRDVARRCIYGVDINPLAVDLACISLWLETLSSEKPLSFLSAHLKSGNSLIGSSIDDILEKQTTLMESTKGRIRFRKTVSDFILLEMLDDDTPESVKTKIVKYNKIQSKGSIYYDLKLLLDAKVAKSFDLDVPPLGDLVSEIGENYYDFNENDAWKEIKRASQEHSFFHWDLEFPQIFYTTDGKKKEEPGFDAIVGNPPYGAKLSKNERQYYKQKLLSVGSTDTAQLMSYMSQKLLSNYGHHGFIIPKAFIYASNWKRTRKRIASNLTHLIDCGRVWYDVNLEQIIYIIQNNNNNCSYLTGSRTNNVIVADTTVSKKDCFVFESLIINLKHNEIRLGLKIHKKSEKLEKYISNRRGGALQNKIQKVGDYKVISGSQIKRYYLENSPRGYIDKKHIDNDNAYVIKNSILAQNIITRSTNPVDYLRITATIPQHTNLIIIDTVNQIVVAGTSPYYVLGLLNSKIINWYAYRFIFSGASMTMHFDSPITNRIPLIVANSDKEKEAIDIVKKLLKAHTQMQNSQGSANIESNINGLKNRLDTLFYEIFDLSNAETKMVTKSMPT